MDVLRYLSAQAASVHYRFGKDRPRRAPTPTVDALTSPTPRDPLVVTVRVAAAPHGAKVNVYVDGVRRATAGIGEAVQVFIPALVGGTYSITASCFAPGYVESPRSLPVSVTVDRVSSALLSVDGEFMHTVGGDLLNPV